MAKIIEITNNITLKLTSSNSINDTNNTEINKQLQNKKSILFFRMLNI